MNTSATAVAFALAVLALIFTLNSVSCGQAAAPTTKQVAVSDKEKTDTAVKNDTAARKDADKPADAEEDVWHREAATGDWGGTRSRWKEKGVEFEISLTSFVQGIASGGIERSSVYNGAFHTELKLDLGKLAGWNYWSAQINTATRFGGPRLEGTGAINPVNAAAMVPAEEGTAFAFGTVSLTRLFPVDLKKGNLFALSVGRFDTLDLVDEDFFGESGIQRFFNIAQNGPLTALRQIPLATNGATFAYVHHGEPVFTLAVLDPNDHSTDAGISDLFADGMSFVPTVNVPMKLFGRSANTRSAAR